MVTVQTRTAEGDKPRIGSATAALLAQVPAHLAEQLRDAIADDLIYVSKFSMDAGQQIVWDAITERGWGPAGISPESVRTTPASKRHLTLVTGGV